MIAAVQKYNSKPTSTSLGTKSLSNLDKNVLVAICKLSQFDYERAPTFGYKRQSDFFSGQLSTGRASRLKGPGDQYFKVPSVIGNKIPVVPVFWYLD